MGLWWGISATAYSTDIKRKKRLAPNLQTYSIPQESAPLTHAPYWDGNPGAPPAHPVGVGVVLLSFCTARQNTAIQSRPNCVCVSALSFAGCQFQRHRTHHSGRSTAIINTSSPAGELHLGRQLQAALEGKPMPKPVPKPKSQPDTIPNIQMQGLDTRVCGWPHTAVPAPLLGIGGRRIMGNGPTKPHRAPPRGVGFSGHSITLYLYLHLLSFIYNQYGVYGVRSA